MSTKVYNGGRVLIDTFLDRKRHVADTLERMHEDYVATLIAKHCANILWNEAANSSSTRSPSLFDEILEFFNDHQHPSPDHPPLRPYNASTRIFFDVDPTNTKYFLINSTNINDRFMAKIYELLNIEDYSYFDNVDKPNDIDDADWSGRKESWDAVDSLDFTYEIVPFVRIINENLVFKQLYIYGKDRLRFTSIDDARHAMYANEPYQITDEKFRHQLKDLRSYVEKQDFRKYLHTLDQFAPAWNDISLNLEDYS